MAGPYYTNSKTDGVDYVSASDFESIETAFSNVDTDKANKVVPGTTNDLAGLSATGDITDSGKTPPSGEIVGTTDTQTLTNKTLGDPTITGSFVETVYAISDGASVDIDPANGTIQTWTLGANRTPTATNFAAGQAVLLMINDGSAYAVDWSTINVTWMDGATPNLDTTDYTHIQLWKVASTVYGFLVGVG